MVVLPRHIIPGCDRNDKGVRWHLYRLQRLKTRSLWSLFMPCTRFHFPNCTVVLLSSIHLFHSIRPDSHTVFPLPWSLGLLYSPGTSHPWTCRKGCGTCSWGVTPKPSHLRRAVNPGIVLCFQSLLPRPADPIGSDVTPFQGIVL